MARKEDLIRAKVGISLLLFILGLTFLGGFKQIDAAPAVKELVYAIPGLPVSVDVDGRVVLHYSSLCVTSNLYDRLLDYKTNPDGRGNMIPVIEKGTPVMEGELAKR